MKVYVADKSIILTGKAWEIKRKLLEYSRTHTLMIDWISSLHTPETKTPLKRIK
ncbi:Z-ring formation inhibitor MciZ [Peribacillus deserti]|uniref:Z-ring formation inhibitor MciZ n=1 Tax=Peribacillus deserti TaxID=673318 RepID=A0A2N5M1L1_9BACI|nr:Z-ring formation inhibitor MciZ [Peribacillus deserti]PLT28258.1 Z-ring formation inhibitor MciZ [Peribacillus deserti]